MRWLNIRRMRRLAMAALLVSLGALAGEQVFDKPRRADCNVLHNIGSGFDDLHAGAQRRRPSAPRSSTSPARLNSP